jgi:hypothetical protein
MAGAQRFVLFLRCGAQHRPQMIPGPDLVLACPHCGAVARLFTLSQGSAVGAISWTDGYQEAPYAPMQPNVVRCHHCSTLHWTVEAKELGMIEPSASADNRAVKFADLTSPAPAADGTPAPEDWAAAPQMKRLDQAGYLEALKEGLATTTDQELELRIHAWWRGNDPHRKLEHPGRYPSTPEAVTNAERLIELAKDGEHELVLFRAEALRELGRFEEAQESLYGLCSDYAPAREKLAELIKARSRDLDVLFL